MTDDPKCPKCHGDMVEREGKYGAFWGCQKYPRCKGIVNIKGNGFNKSPKVVVNRQPRKIANPSKYQQEIFKAVESMIKNGDYEGSKNLIVEAVAGSGKTATIEHLVTVIREFDPQASIVYLVFNKRVQVEAQEKGLPALTTHSKYFSDYRKVYSKVKVDSNKVRDIVENIVGKNEELEWVIPTVCQIVGKVKNTMSELDNVSLDELCNHYGIQVNGEADYLFDIVRKTMEINNGQVNIVDFDDMLYLTHLKNAPIKKFDWVLADEVQDFNALQVELVIKTVAKHAVVVGDRNQSIYAFRGAALDSMDRIKNALQAKELPLSISYRVGQAHAALVNQLFPHIPFEAYEHADEGMVGSVSASKMFTQIKEKDVVLCRVNAPLVRPAFQLIREGRKAVILGRDIGKGLVTLVNKFDKKVRGKMTDEERLNKVLDALYEYRTEQVARLLYRKKMGAAQTLDDQVKTINAIAEECDTLAELRARIESIFSDEADGIMFSSVHKFKGGESDVVYLLESHNMPHPMAELEHEIRQEINIAYVAVTRAKKELYFVDNPIPSPQQFMVQ